jgi:putative oxidoreductase
MRGFRLIAVWFVQILLAALFALQGVMKISGSQTWLARFKAWGYPEHFYLVVGVIELAGAIALLVPRVASYGAALLIAVMAGAAVTHATHGERQIVTNVILMILLAIVFYLRWREQRLVQASV